MEPTPNDEIRFYYSFRSPYAWLAAERLEDELGNLGVPIVLNPVFPTPGTFPNDPTNIPEKVAYLLQDVPRLAREQGLSVRFPERPDTDWATPHAAALEADRLGAGRAFLVEVFRKRFSEGQDVGQEDVVAEAATAAGLDSKVILEAARTDALREQVSAAWTRAKEEDGIFGVPSFVFRGRLYWGQDRMRHLRGAVERKLAAS